METHPEKDEPMWSTRRYVIDYFANSFYYAEADVFGSFRTYLDRTVGASALVASLFAHACFHVIPSSRVATAAGPFGNSHPAKYSA